LPCTCSMWNDQTESGSHQRESHGWLIHILWHLAALCPSTSHIFICANHLPYLLLYSLSSIFLLVISISLPLSPSVYVSGDVQQWIEYVWLKLRKKKIDFSTHTHVLSLSLALSVTHTHTHTHIHEQEKGGLQKSGTTC
jgi:hypothetical protein